MKKKFVIRLKKRWIYLSVAVVLVLLIAIIFDFKSMAAEKEKISDVSVTYSYGTVDGNSIYRPKFESNESEQYSVKTEYKYDIKDSERGMATVIATARNGYYFGTSSWKKADIDINCNEGDANFYKMKSATSSKLVFYVKYNLDVAAPDEAKWEEKDDYYIAKWSKAISSPDDEVFYQVKFRGNVYKVKTNKLELNAKKGENTYSVRIMVTANGNKVYSDWTESENLYSYSNISNTGNSSSNTNSSSSGGPGVSNIYWYQTNGYWYCRVGGNNVYSNWVKSNGYWYYLTKDGTMATGWIQLDGCWYYLSTAEPYGHMVVGDQNINEQWYHFTDSGIWYQ